MNDPSGWVGIFEMGIHTLRTYFNLETIGKKLAKSMVERTPGLHRSDFRKSTAVEHCLVNQQPKKKSVLYRINSRFFVPGLL